MPTYGVQVALHSTSGLPRDDAVNVLHYINPAGGDLGTLCQDVVNAYTAFMGNVGGAANKVTATAYDAEGAPPHYPIATKSGALVPTTGGPREVALCLSFFGGVPGQPDTFRNVASQRGRIYLGPLSHAVISGERPTNDASGPMAAAMTLGTALAAAGGDAFTWVIWSRKRSTAYQVGTIWVDDEWDAQRRRGYRATTRRTANV